MNDDSTITECLPQAGKPTTDDDDDDDETSELELMPTDEFEQLLEPTANQPQVVHDDDLEVDGDTESNAGFDPYNRD